MLAATAEDFRARLQRFVRGQVPTDADAEDIVQDVMLRLWLHRDDVDEGSVAAWLFRVARNAVADLHRARGRAPAQLGDEFDVAVHDAAPPRQLAACLLPMLDELDEPDRETLRRVDLEGQSQTDLAQALGISVSGAKSRVQRARQRLHRAVTDCCRLELDRRGLPLDEWQCRHRRGCDC